ncbi:hypothetical protein VNO77_34540 [Canavalia gladiata]|uniref:Uncharacterized protein n=1 Tax=Canavalia gladiata TaxID=3824 RepID=A0AAN9KGC3_CANGL
MWTRISSSIRSRTSTTTRITSRTKISTTGIVPSTYPSAHLITDPDLRTDPGHGSITGPDASINTICVATIGPGAHPTTGPGLVPTILPRPSLTTGPGSNIDPGATTVIGPSTDESSGPTTSPGPSIDASLSPSPSTNLGPRIDPGPGTSTNPGLGPNSDVGPNLTTGPGPIILTSFGSKVHLHDIREENLVFQTQGKIRDSAPWERKGIIGDVWGRMVISKHGCNCGIGGTKRNCWGSNPRLWIESVKYSVNALTRKARSILIPLFIRDNTRYQDNHISKDIIKYEPNQRLTTLDQFTLTSHILTLNDLGLRSQITLNRSSCGHVEVFHRIFRTRFIG